MSAARRSFSILLVDGDETLQGLRALMLRLRGYRVERVPSIPAAEEKLAAGGFDLVLIDIRQFVKVAVEFCESAKATHPGLKIAFLADHTLYLSRESCPDDVIARQDGPEQFLRQVDELVRASA
jgi:CheY-like chemotaxis protein